MQLPFFTKETSTKNLYLGLFLKEEEGIAMVLTLKNGEIQILEKEKFIYSNGWENLTEDVDEVLFKIEKNLNIELQETIFFIYSHLLNEKGTEIKKPYLNKIKELVKNLELHPLGYIECYEAVSLYLTEKEETPITAILVELDATQLAIFIYKGGKISYRKILPRSQNLVDDLTAGFADLKGTFLLPARIILYNSKDLDDESVKILTHRWSEEYFVQLPKVEILKEEEVIEGLIKIFQEQKLTTGQSLVKEEEKTRKETLGFLIGGDIGEQTSPAPISVKTASLIDKIKEIVKKISLPKIAIPQKLSVVVGTLFIILGLAINELFFHKATLTVFVPSATITKSTTVQVPYKIATVSAEFSESKITSGKREIGEKAKGEVAVYNTNLNKEKLFKKGTEIESSGLKFVFDDEVKVATASSATTPGTNKVKVTAAVIGSVYNLPKGKRFNIDDTSYAESNAAFTGGSKREIQTISQKDIEDLKISIIEKAKKANKTPIKNSGNEIIIPQLSTFNLGQTTASGEVGEEVSSVSLKAKVDSLYYYYQKSELLAHLVDIITPQVPSGFTLKKEAINYNVDSVSKKDSAISLNLSLKVKAIKEVSETLLLKKVVGRHKNSLNNLLKRDFQVEGYNINIKEPLPILNNFLPFISSNITLIISSL